MKWIGFETMLSRIERHQKWHTWFAWRPVRTGTITTPDCKTRYVYHWLCYVERKRFICEYTYREIDTNGETS